MSHVLQFKTFLIKLSIYYFEITSMFEVFRYKSLHQGSVYLRKV